MAQLSRYGSGKSATDVFEFLDCSEECRTEDAQNVYSTWAANYDQDMTTFGYQAPQQLVSVMHGMLGGVNPSNVRVLDVAAGTGMVGSELQKLGYTNADGLDANPDMLKVAENKHVYQRLIEAKLGTGQLPVAPAISDITDEFFVCQVCLKDFIQPKILPCLHTFCQPCLKKLLVRQHEEKLSCPTCRQKVLLPQNGLEGLKSNFLVDKLRNILQQKQKRKTSKTRETSKFEDPHEQQMLFCDTCHRVITRHCVVTTHKDHQFYKVRKVAERERAKITAELSTVKKTVNIRCERIENLRSVKDEWSLQVQDTEEQIEKQTKATIRALKKVKNDRISQLRAMNAAREKQLEAAMEAAEIDLASAESCIQFTHNVLEYGSPVEVISVSGELVGRLGQIADEKKAEKSEWTENIVNLTFDPPAGELEQEVAKLVGDINQVRTSLRSPQTTQVQPNMMIGKVDTSVKHVKTARESGSGDRINQVTTYLPLPQTTHTHVRPKVVIDMGDTRLKQMKTVGELGSGDGQFNVPLPVTTEGDIVVADYGNSRLQFLNKDGSFKLKVKLRFKPMGVSVLSNDELLVTGDGHMIHVLDKRGRGARVIQVPGAADQHKTTRGAAVDGSGRVIVTIGHQVFILSPSDDVVRRFGDKGQGQQQLGSNLRVAVNSRDQIIISDYHNHCLKIFDPSGRHLFTSGSRGSGTGQLEWPDSVIADSEDNIIVVDNTYDAVLIVGAFTPNWSHLQPECFEELVQITKPGGFIIVGTSTSTLASDIGKAMEAKLRELQERSLLSIVDKPTRPMFFKDWEGTFFVCKVT
ncbi:TRIM2 [Branchiostoma lanceolatum]|uniref:RING-type E3 ubiquitin transferase n=1 Tax=Branchiostoma lanceolatum TaxID=7740 RepID=A0A8K0EWY8_BRALA|nr:TRIM2 [Branchiostoma lanceolatum]